MKSILWVCAALLASQAAACSVYMEATRPTPVDLTQYQEGMTRDAVLEKLGAPDSTAHESDGLSCDFYQLYTHGYGAGGKIPIAIAESAADFFTLGLAEVALTPTEGVTKNEKHPVTICYNAQKLVRIDDKGQPIVAEDKNPPITAASSPTSDVPPGTTPSAAAAIASDQPKTDSKPAALISATTTTANPTAAVIPTTGAVNPSTKPASPAVPNVIPAAAVVSPAAAPVNPEAPVVNPAVGDQWNSTDHPE
jgi:hypothetical protein